MTHRKRASLALLSLHEPLKLLRSHFAILICIYDIEDALVDRRHLVERERAIPIRIAMANMTFIM